MVNAVALLFVAMPLSAARADEEGRIRDRQAALMGELRTAKTPEDAAGVAAEFLTLADEAAGVDCYDLALKAADQASKIGVSSKNAALSARAQARILEIKDTQQEYNRAKPAFKTLETKPDDGEAHLVAGKFLAYHKGDWTGALKHFQKCSDAAFRSAAEKEPKASDTGARLAVGTEWWTLAESKKGLERDRLRLHAAEPYRAAWPDLEGLLKEDVRARAMAAQSRMPERKGQGKTPAPWGTSTDTLVWLDDKFAHSGKSSVFCAALNKDVREGWVGVSGAQIAAAEGRKLTVSFWTLADGNGPGDLMLVRFFNAAGECFGQSGIPVPVDVPFWTRTESAVVCPKKTSRVDFSLQRRSRTGVIWLDDLSVRNPEGTGLELAENGGFERR